MLFMTIKSAKFLSEAHGSIISDASVTVILIAVLAMALFLVKVMRSKEARLIHKLYFAVTICTMIWMIAVIGLNYTPAENVALRHAFDSLTYVGAAYAPVLGLLIALKFAKPAARLSKTELLLLAVPTLTNIIAWTNPLHHLLYRELAFRSADIVFGPYIFITGAYSYSSTVASVAVMLAYAFRAKKRIVIQQAALFSLGSVVPGLVSLAATLKLVDLSIAATPMAFIATVLLHGYAIYHYHMLDIRPAATRQILDEMTDCFLIMDELGEVLDCNRSFREVFSNYGLESGKRLEELMKAEDIENKTAVYNLMSAINSSRQDNSTITFEQTALTCGVKRYYVVDLTPLIIDNTLCGYIAMFKDVTKLKEGMEKLQQSQARLMERERLASLGQMAGGLAHNLKTPIMSIAGSSAAIENLIDECVASIGDTDVTEEDYREIYFEAREWLSKMRDACSYMSDIITAVKGQAATMTGDDDACFSAQELTKRVALLMRHELQGAHAQLKTEANFDLARFAVTGDINSLVQVVNNLVSNACDATKPKGEGDITLRLTLEQAGLTIRVEDRGTGVSQDVRSRLFRQMVTDKGAQGTGLGIYISQTILKAKFGASMWFEDNPGGGAIFALTIPRDSVRPIEDAMMIPGE